MNHSAFAKNDKIGAFQIGLLFFTILLLCGLVIDTIFVLPKQVSDLVHMIDTFGCGIFFLDFCYRFYTAESKLAFMKWGWIDLIACVPNLEILRWGRLARVLRIIRLLRGIRSTQLLLTVIFQERLRSGAVSIIVAALLLVGFSSVSILVCERQPGANINTPEDALWWSIATITTVGYGDKYPVTTEGRVIGIILMLGGVSMFSCLSGLAASFFLGAPSRDKAELREVLARLELLQARLDRLGCDPSRASGNSVASLSNSGVET